MKRRFTHIRDLETDEVGEVVDLLSTQFTAIFGDRLRFYLLRDRRVTWEVEKK